MNKIRFLIILLVLLFSCETEKNPCTDIGCDFICESGYVLDENDCQTCECVEYRERYIGQWEFIKYWNVTHPYDPTSGEKTWIGEISYGDNDSTLSIPNNPILEGCESTCFYEFQINILGEINEDNYDAGNFNYHFDGYITPDSLYYTSGSGSPFSSFIQTIYGKKLY